MTEVIRPAVPSAEAVLNIAAGCSLHCTYCNRSPDRLGQSMAEVLSEGFEVPSARRVVIGSGDVARPELASLVRRLRAGDTEEVVVYCHSGLHDASVLSVLSDVGLTGLLVAVPAADAAGMAALTRGTGSLRRLATVLAEAGRLGLSVELDVPVLAETWSVLPDTVRRAMNRVERLDAVHLTFAAGAVRGLPKPWDFRRARRAVEDVFALARERGVPVRLANPAPPPCVLDVRGADIGLYPSLRARGGGERPAFFDACAACALSSRCAPQPIHFAPEPDLGPVLPVRLPAGGEDPGLPSSAELFLRRQTLSDLLDRLARAPHLACTSPWAVLAAHDPSGGVAPCRGSLLHKPVMMACGDWRRTSLLDLWNSDGLRQVRRAIASGRPHDTCKDHCPAFFGLAHTYEAPPTMPAGRAFFDNLVLQLEETLDRAEVLRSRPRCLVVSPSLRCNNHCRMCEMHDSEPEMAELPEVVYRSVLELLPTLKDLSLAGAEPLMSSRLPALLRECDAARYPDLELTMTTNGLLLDPAILADMARVRFHTIIVSINAATPGTYERVSGTPQGFERVIRNVRALVDRSRGWPGRPRVVLSFVAMRSNIGEMGAFVDLARSLGVGFRLIPIERDRMRESVFTDEETLRAAIETFDRDVAPRLDGLPSALAEEARVLERRMRLRLSQRQFSPL